MCVLNVAFAAAAVAIVHCPCRLQGLARRLLCQYIFGTDSGLFAGVRKQQVVSTVSIFPMKCHFENCAPSLHGSSVGN